MVYKSDERIIFTRREDEPFLRIFFVYGPVGFNLTGKKKALANKFLNFLNRNLDPGISRIDVEVSNEGVAYEGYIGGTFRFSWEDIMKAEFK